MDRKVLLTRLGFFVLENEIIDTSSSLTSIFPYYNGLKTPKDSINRTYNQLMVYIEGLENPILKTLLPSTIINYIYDSYPSNSTFLSLGTLSALLDFTDESLLFSFNDVRDSFSDLDNYFTKAMALYDALDVIASMDISILNDLINSQLNNLYYFTGGFAFLFLLMYFCYYYPMISSDIKFLNKLIEIILIVPKNK